MTSSKFSKFEGVIKDIDGNEYKIKRVTLRKEIEIFKILGELAQSSGTNVDDLSKITSLTPTAYAKIASILLDMSEDEVLDKFDLRSITQFVVPFLNQYNEDLVPRVEEPAQNTNLTN